MTLFLLDFQNQTPIPMLLLWNPVQIQKCSNLLSVVGPVEESSEDFVPVVEVSGVPEAEEVSSESVQTLPQTEVMERRPRRQVSKPAWMQSGEYVVEM